MAVIDLLNLQPTVISRDLRDKYILLAGKPKVGKTEFCTLIPHSLIFAFEKGTNAKPNAFVQPIQTWSDFKLAIRQLENVQLQQKFQTICIDTVAIAYQLCEDFICAQNGVMKIGDIPYGAGYKALSKEFEGALRKITMLGYGLVLTSHLRERIEKDKNGNEVYAGVPDLNDRCLGIVNGLVDIIGVIVQDWNEKNESERWLITRATPTIAAGTRFKYLAPKIPFGYENFVQALGEAIDKEAENGATVVDKVEIVEEKKKSYEECREEALILWNKLCMNQDGTLNEENEHRVLKRIQMIFGRPIRLSEITEDQVDLYELVLTDMKELLNN